MKKIIILFPLFIFFNCSLFYFPLYQTVELNSDQSDINVQVLGDGKIIEEFTFPQVKEIRLRKAFHTVFRFSKTGYYSNSMMLDYKPSKIGLLSLLINIPTVFLGYFLVDEPLGAVYLMNPEKIQIQLLPISSSSVQKEININVDLRDNKVSLSTK